MIDICEAFRILNSLNEEDDTSTKIINIDVEVALKYFDEDLPSGIKNANYDDQTIDDWYNFTANIEEIIEIELGFTILDVAHSNRGNNLSTYYYIITPNDSTYIINLRVSDHKANSAIRDNRIKHVKNYIQSKNIQAYKLKGITVNDKSFKTYDEALKQVKTILSNL